MWVELLLSIFIFILPNYNQTVLVGMQVIVILHLPWEQLREELKIFK